MRTAAARGDQALVYLNRQSETAGKASAKGIGDLNKQIADQQKLLNDAIAKGSDSEIKAIGNRIVALQEELKVREKLTKAIVDALQFQGFVPTSIDAGSISVPLVWPKIKKSPDQKTPEQINQEMVTLRPMGDEAEQGIKKQEKTNKDEDAALKKQLELRKELVHSAIDLTMQLLKQVGVSDEAAQAIGTAIDALSKLSTDPIGAATDALSMIISLLPSQAQKFADQMAVINEAIKEAQRLIDVSERLGGGTDARQKAIDLATQKKAADEDALAKAIKKKDDKVFAIGPVYEADKKRVIELTAAVAADQAAIEDAQNTLTDFLTATNEMNIADSIEKGFEDGKTSAADFAETFNDFMRTAINSALEEASKPEVAAWYKKFAADMESGGGLDPSEVADLKIDWDKIIADGNAQRDAAYKIAGISPNDGTLSQSSSLTSTIQRSITEDTATEWVGLIRKYSDDTRQIRDYAKLGVDRLVSIDMNTANTVIRLDSAIVELKNIVQNTKQVYSGLGG